VIAIARAGGVEVREEPLDAGVLRAAREVFASGSVRGVEPVRALDGDAIGGRGELAATIAGVLRARWLGGARPQAIAAAAAHGQRA
jgi:branched-subunit amino acid aminotransferase/4-amino-4-deoxychorismate lyase